MNFRLSEHAKKEMALRAIPADVLEAVLDRPEQIVPDPSGLQVYQSKADFGGKMYLLRAFVNDAVDPALVVTVYRTSKINKYWRA